ncbi:hypothetical protein [Prevotella pallens]|jgi:hypothetical protein|uniref:hypothetical protein n=1 Tax=Prevotella pallens TaxID=60133 RepID=UPI001CAE5E5C|nr:hypothetical protein [Prevotella pallens]MBF1475538.1 hypothetical protein [Prevotella pallens]MBF1517455.1 hypothetical protein [Prevotella pallens]MBF1520194.1 hypothetical protein [Prevotella pallens]
MEKGKKESPEEVTVILRAGGSEIVHRLDRRTAGRLIVEFESDGLHASLEPLSTQCGHEGRGALPSLEEVFRPECANCDGSRRKDLGCSVCHLKFGAPYCLSNTYYRKYLEKKGKL